MGAPKENRNAVGNKGGRPRKFQSAEELQKQINAFFKECDDNKELPTVTGLALALDTSRTLLCNYEKEPNFANIIKRAKSLIEKVWKVWADEYEEQKKEKMKIKNLAEDLLKYRTQADFKSPVFP